MTALDRTRLTGPSRILGKWRARIPSNAGHFFKIERGVSPKKTEYFATRPR